MIDHAEPTTAMGKHYRNDGIGTINIAPLYKCTRLSLLHFSAIGLFITQYHSLRIFFSMVV